MVRRDVRFDEEKAMRVSLGRELELHADEDILAPKVEEPQIDVDQPHTNNRGMETSTQEEYSKEGTYHTREADRLLDDALGECGSTHLSAQPVWVDVMVEEYDSIVRNNVWDVVPRREDTSVVSSRWIYKIKQAANGSVEKHKAIFVARGFSRVEGIDYHDTFVPVARYLSIRSILAL
eukprot:PITA_01501